MPSYIVRRSKDCSTVIMAESETEALEIASNQDANDWDSEWSDIEAEEQLL